MDGLPNANSTCDHTIKGDAYPFLPKLRGLLTTPGTTPLFQTLKGSLACQYDLISGEEQSVVLTVSYTTGQIFLPHIPHIQMTATTPSLSGTLCRTGCDGTGCQCNSPHTLGEVDHILIHSNNVTLGCFCGDFTVTTDLFTSMLINIFFQNYLPITFSSANQMRLEYKASNFQYQGHANGLKFSANYEFIKTRKVLCGKLHFNSTKGVLNSWSIVSSLLK